jgi:hypothetical protein
MDEAAVARARERIESRPQPAELEAALERARTQVEALAETAADLESALPERVGSAVREGVRAEALPVARQLAEVRGLMNHMIRRMERIEGDLAAERHARVDDLALLVDLVSSGWRGVDDRIRRLEETLGANAGATVYRIDEAR